MAQFGLYRGALKPPARREVSNWAHWALRAYERRARALQQHIAAGSVVSRGYLELYPTLSLSLVSMPAVGLLAVGNCGGRFVSGGRQRSYSYDLGTRERETCMIGFAVRPVRLWIVADA